MQRTTEGPPSSKVASNGDAHRQPSVSVVIPTYNSGERIRATLQSVLEQSYRNITEVIVVDDGSQDGTPQLVRSEFPEVTVICQENQGGAAARNRGAEAATGDYIAFLDHDDEWVAGKIEAQVNAMRRHPGIALLTSSATYAICGGEGQDRPQPSRTPHANCGGLLLTSFRDWFARNEVFTWFCSFSGWLVKRDAFWALGGVDESAWPADDLEFLVRAAGRGYMVAVLCESLVKYWVREDSVSHSSTGRRRNAVQIPEVLSQYDPSGSGWRSELLTPEEFAHGMAKQHYQIGRGLWDAGYHTEAREHLRAALSCDQLRLTERLKRLFAAYAPGTYHALSALWR